MSLATDVREQIRRYVVGAVDADDLSDWLDTHAQQIHDSGNSELRQLADLTHSLLEDVVQGLRTEADAQHTLTMRVPSEAPHTANTLSDGPIAPHSNRL